MSAPWRVLGARVRDDERGAGYVAAFIVLFSTCCSAGVGVLVDSLAVVDGATPVVVDRPGGGPGGSQRHLGADLYDGAGIRRRPRRGAAAAAAAAGTFVSAGGGIAAVGERRRQPGDGRGVGQRRFVVPVDGWAHRDAAGLGRRRGRSRRTESVEAERSKPMSSRQRMRRPVGVVAQFARALVVLLVVVVGVPALLLLCARAGFDAWHPLPAVGSWDEISGFFDRQLSTTEVVVGCDAGAARSSPGCCGRRWSCRSWRRWARPAAGRRVGGCRG